MNFKNHYVSTNPFLKNVFFLAGGTAFAQLITLLISPILTRVFVPSDFGTLAIFTSIVSLFSVVSTLRYEIAIPLNKSLSAASNTVFLSLVILIVFSLLISLFALLILVDSQFVSLDYELILLIPIAVVLFSLFQIFNYLAISQSRFKVISKASIWQSLGMSFGQICAGFFNLGGLGLVLGLLFGRLLALISIIREGIFKLKNIKLKRVYMMAYKHKKFPLFTVWASLINVLGMQAMPLIFQYYFGLKIAGLMALTIRMLGAPSVLIGQAIGKVFYQSAAKNIDNQDLIKEIILRLSSSLFMIAFPLFAAIAIYGDEIFAIIFGEGWRGAGVFAQYLSPWLLMSFISSPLSTFSLVKGKQRTALYITLYETALRLLVLVLGAQYWGIDSTVMMYSAVGFTICIIYIAWILFLAGSNYFEWIKLNYCYLIKAAAMLIALISLKLLATPIVALVMTGFLVGLLYVYSYKSIINNLKLES